MKCRGFAYIVASNASHALREPEDLELYGNAMFLGVL